MRQGGIFPWKTATLLLIFFIYYTVNRDIETNGSFEDSRTGKFLADFGLDNHALIAYDFTTTKYNEAKKWTLKKGLPQAKRKWKEAQEWAQPHFDKFVRNAGELQRRINDGAYNLLVKLDQTWPGSKTKVLMVREEVVKASKFAWERTCEIGEIAYKLGHKVAMTGYGYIEGYVKPLKTGKWELKDIGDACDRWLKTAVKSAMHFYNWATEHFRIKV